jgi:hypothetical protein
MQTALLTHSKQKGTLVPVISGTRLLYYVAERERKEKRKRKTQCNKHSFFCPNKIRMQAGQKI